MNQHVISQQSTSAWWRVRAIDLGLVAWLGLYALVVFQVAIGTVFPDADIPHISRTLEETITSCEVAVGVSALVVLILLLAFALTTQQPPAVQRSAPDCASPAARPAGGFAREIILLVILSVVCATLAVSYLPYRSAAYDFLAVFSAGASPGFLAALLLWTRRCDGFDLWLW